MADGELCHEPCRRNVSTFDPQLFLSHTSCTVCSVSWNMEILSHYLSTGERHWVRQQFQWMQSAQRQSNSFSKLHSFASWPWRTQAYSKSEAFICSTASHRHSMFALPHFAQQPSFMPPAGGPALFLPVLPLTFFFLCASNWPQRIGWENVKIWTCSRSAAAQNNLGVGDNCVNWFR